MQVPVGADAESDLRFFFAPIALSSLSRRQGAAVDKDKSGVDPDFRRARIIFDCRMTDDPAMIN